MFKKIALGLVLGAAVVMPSAAIAQDRGGNTSGNQQDRGSDTSGRNRGGGNFDPAQFRQRYMDDLKTALAPSDDEWKVIQPKLEKVMDTSRDSRAFGGYGRRGGGRGGDAGNSTDRPRSAVQQAADDLNRALDNKNATAEEITQKLQALREARDKARADLQAAQKDLKEVLSARQEAVLVSRGMME